MRKFLLAALLALAPSVALALTPADFPLPRRFSEIVKVSEESATAPGPFCDPAKDELLATFKVNDTHYKMLVAVDAEGAARVLFIQYGADGNPVAVYLTHAKSLDNDVIEVDRALTIDEAKVLWPNPCNALYPERT